ncbi:MAG TPA: DMT family transporter [Methylomirabilota bacterium]|nr:DMT family transporter [Methylomirabilota bacterium]
MQALVATVALLGVTAVWGWTFVIVHDAVAVWGVVAFLAVRFAIAGASAAALWGRRLDRRALRVGGGIGLVLAAGYLLQTWGLKHTTATNAGLITGLFVVLAPVADRVLNGTVMRRVAWLAVALSLVGMTMLTGRLPTDLALGDLLVLGCAVAFGVHIALLSRHARGHDPRALTLAQMLGVAVVFLVMWPLADTVEAPPRQVWFALALTGLVASTVAYGIQTWAQRHLSAARTAVILTTEPMFAAMFGILLAGERLGPVQAAGAVLILSAVVLSEAVPVVATQRLLRRGR